MTKVGIELLGQLKIWKSGECVKIIPFPARQWRKFSGNVRVILCATLCAALYAYDGVLHFGKAKTTKDGMVWYELNIAYE